MEQLTLYKCNNSIYKTHPSGKKEFTTFDIQYDPKVTKTCEINRIVKYLLVDKKQITIIKNDLYSMLPKQSEHESICTILFCWVYLEKNLFTLDLYGAPKMSENQLLQINRELKKNNLVVFSRQMNQQVEVLHKVQITDF